MIKTMADLYPTAIILVDWALQDDGDGLYFSIWNEKKLGEKPTIDTLIAHEQTLTATLAAQEAKAATDKAALLKRLGITADEATLLLS